MDGVSVATLPAQISERLRPGEGVRDVVLVRAGDGGGSPGAGDQWIVLTDERILFGGRLPDTKGAAGRQVFESGSIPLSALSAAEVARIRAEADAPERKSISVSVARAGVRIFIPLPGREEAFRLQRNLEQLLEAAARRSVTP